MPAPEHPWYRKRAFAAFFQLAALTGDSRTALRRWLAAEIGIDDRYCVIADMDETECFTVTEICNARAAEITEASQRRESKKRKPKPPPRLMPPI